MSKIAPVRITDVAGTPLGTVSNPVFTQPSGDSSSSGGIGGNFVGKTSGGDFTITYASPTTLTLGTLPDGTSLTGDDIVLIEQINTAGAVVATYTRSEATMTMAGNVLTVAGAVFVTTDLIVINTNIPRNGGVLVGADAQTNATLHTTFLSRLMGFNGTTWDRIRTAVTTVSATLTGMLNTLPWGIYHATPTTRTDGQGGPFEQDANGNTKETMGTYLAGEPGSSSYLNVSQFEDATTTNALTVDQSQALEASSIAKASAGNLYAAFGTISASAPTGEYFVHLEDSATLPADGAVTHIITPCPVDHTFGKTSSWTFPDSIYKRPFTAGCVSVLSTANVTKAIAGAYMISTIRVK